MSAATAAVVSPAYEAWGGSGSAVRRAGLTTPSAADTMANGANIPLVGAPNNLDRQYVWPCLVPGLTFVGTVKSQLRAQANAPAAYAQMCIKVVSADGLTTRAVLLPLQGGSTYGGAFAISPAEMRNVVWATPTFGATITNPYVTVLGDRPVVEFGYFGATGTARWGSSAASDLPEDNTTTTDLRPWIEFSANLTFLAESPVRTMIARHNPTVRTMIARHG